MERKTPARNCFIPGCPSQAGQGQVVFLSAYKSDGLQRWWSESLWVQHRKNKTIPKNTRVCERHFEEKYIDRSYKMPRLFPDAWPTMNLIEPTPEELAKVRIDGRGRPREVGAKVEFNPKVYCRFCGRKDKRPLDDQLDHLKGGEEVLKFCLGEYFSREDLPRGVCVNCMETVESFVDFVKTCEETQRKLEELFVQNENMKLEPDCQLLENINLKQEKEDELLEHYESGFQIEILEESDPKVPEIKSEEFVVHELDEEPEDFVPIDDDRASSDSSRSDEEDYKPDDDGEGSKYKIRSSISSDSEDSEMDSDDEPLVKRKSPKKKPGPKPRRSIQVREDLGTLDVVDEFPAAKKKERKSKPKTSPSQRKPRKSSSGPGETSRICPICGKILVHKGNFTSHLKIHSEKKDYVCNICGKQYYIRRELQMHIESLHEKKTFVCNICGIKCAWRKGLQRHMKNKHSDESSLKHKCTYCGKAFLLPNQLRLHVMKHTGDRITCEICGAGYRFNYMLTQHKIREHGMEFKGVKLYKTSSRSRKATVTKQEVQDDAAAAVASITTPTTTPSTPVHQPHLSSAPPPPPIGGLSHVLEPSHDSILSSESSQSHQIQHQQQQQPQQQQQQQQHQQQQQQQHTPLQYQHPTASQLERIHYPPGFVYAGGAPPAMMLPPGGYNG